MKKFIFGIAVIALMSVVSCKGNENVTPEVTEETVEETLTEDNATVSNGVESDTTLTDGEKTLFF